MFGTKIKSKKRTFLFFSFYVSVILAVLTAQNTTEAGQSKVLEGIWDSTKYIDLDEIKPGMKAECLTEYGIAGIEKFGLEVVDVVRDFEPGLDIILVSGTDERFKHTGPVAGCSGSPVYINGRIAGALAYAWAYAKDPLYGVTPISEMLKVGLGTQTESTKQSMGQGPAIFDFSKPIDLTEAYSQYRAGSHRAFPQRPCWAALGRRSRPGRWISGPPFPPRAPSLRFPGQACRP